MSKLDKQLKKMKCIGLMAYGGKIEYAKGYTAGFGYYNVNNMYFPDRYKLIYITKEAKAQQIIDQEKFANKINNLFERCLLSAFDVGI